MQSFFQLDPNNMDLLEACRWDTHAKTRVEIVCRACEVYRKRAQMFGTVALCVCVRAHRLDQETAYSGCDRGAGGVCGVWGSLMEVGGW